MAKCVTNKWGTVERVSDTEAARRVASGEWRYTSKTQYKRYIANLPGKD